MRGGRINLLSVFLASSCAQSRNFDLSPINQFSTIQEFFAYHLTINSVQYCTYGTEKTKRGEGGWGHSTYSNAINAFLGEKKISSNLASKSVLCRSGLYDTAIQLSQTTGNDFSVHLFSTVQKSGMVWIANMKSIVLMCHSFRNKMLPYAPYLSYLSKIQRNLRSILKHTYGTKFYYILWFTTYLTTYFFSMATKMS